MLGEEGGIYTTHSRAVIHRQRFIAYLALIIRQVKEAVTDDGPAHGASKLLSPVMGFRDPVLLVDRIVGVGRGIQNVVVAVAVNLVCAALGYSVHDSAAGLSELGLKAATRDLEFPDHVLAELVGD